MPTKSRPQEAADQNSVVGCLLGTAVGDALGLPYEGLSRRRGQSMYGAPDRYRFCFGKGMVSDDTEHTCMVAQALLTAILPRNLFFLIVVLFHGFRRLLPPY